MKSYIDHQVTSRWPQDLTWPLYSRRRPCYALLRDVLSHQQAGFVFCYHCTSRQTSSAFGLMHVSCYKTFWMGVLILSHTFIYSISSP